jgi:hypothetical protein
MLTALVLTALLAQAPAANQSDAGALPAGTPAATTSARRDTPTVQTGPTENSPLPKVPDGTAGSNVLEPGKSPVEPDREALPKSVSDVPLPPLGPAPPASTGTTEKNTGSRTGGGANRVDSIR